MKQKTYLMATSAIFALIAVLHIARIIYGWPANIGGFDIPIWASWVALPIAGGLSFFGFKLWKSS